MKLQHLNLGSGTSQHVLISGKTGSGKSTLLHVLITNLALRYAPDEVELYLIDFKKGVEFKAYARSALPHARVVAIESEREFGLSVLQKLDSELRDRGDLFRRRGLQDLKGYRNAEPDARLPRILLVIDEFQELFTEDDRIAQDSALLLDRLVRQGRAFGIHVMLGSQTLGGAYTLARSTIGQMAVRIALQCSESDAHLILSEDNTAARLLTRPGEAIYNDANGLYEGNHPFQVVWLPDNERDDYLERIDKLQERRGFKSQPQIVFEGNVLSDLGDNENLKELLMATEWPAEAPAAHAWLGSAVAIKEPTSAAFLRQNGSNLLMVGHREEAALGVLSGCFVSLAAQHSPGVTGQGSGIRGLAASAASAKRSEVRGQRSEVGGQQNDRLAAASTRRRSGLEDGNRKDAASDASNPQSPIANPSDGTGAKFYILDGMRADAPEVGFWNRLAAAAPHEVKIGGIKEAAGLIGELAAELSARRQEGSENAAARLPVPLQPGPLPRPAEGGRIRLFQRRGRGTGQPGETTCRLARRRPAAGHPHADLVRHVRQRLADARPAGDAGFRDARPLPDERQRFEQLDGLARGRQTRRASGHPLRRRPGPGRKVPPLRTASSRVSGLGQETVGPVGKKRKKVDCYSNFTEASFSGAPQRGQ